MRHYLNMKIYKRGKYWYFEHYANGRRIQRSLGTTDKAEAERLRKKLQTEIIKGKLIEVERTPTIDAFMKDYLVDVSHRIPASYDKINLAFRHLYEVVQPNTQLNRISGQHATLLVAWHKKRGSSVETINTDIRKLKTAFQTAFAWELVSKNPFVHVKPLKSDPKEPSVLTKEQVSELREVFRDPAKHLRKSESDMSRRLPDDEVWQHLFEFYMQTGARRNEILNLRWEDIGEDTMYVRGKGKRARYVPINKKLAQTIKSMGRKDIGKVFDITPNHATHIFSRAMKRIGMGAGDAIHVIRRTFDTFALYEGISPKVLGDITGQSIRTIETNYAGIIGSHAMEAMRKFSV